MDRSRLTPQSLSPVQTELAAAMIIQSYPTRTIEFFLKIYPHLLSHPMNCTQMAEVYGATPQAVYPHVHALTGGRFLQREHYRLWRLGPRSYERDGYEESQGTPSDL